MSSGLLTTINEKKVNFLFHGQNNFDNDEIGYLVENLNGRYEMESFIMLKVDDLKEYIQSKEKALTLLTLEIETIKEMALMSDFPLDLKESFDEIIQTSKSLLEEIQDEIDNSKDTVKKLQDYFYTNQVELF